ncbi:MAG: ADP-forming succinate--CoA ligase subunit beta [Bdellovibrionaceae bacterium]|nr:ADP-forming succinate--CoA ligase subunit beta [Pseudobdellovibrionaceae bacterium]
MNLHEYQAKELLQKYHIPTLKNKLCTTADKAEALAQELGGKVWVIKAQIHAGGRGQGGGVKLAKNLAEVTQHANDILKMNLVTKQTGPKGKIVNKIIIEEGCAIESEFYVALLVDRAKDCITLMASPEGGMDIEDVAENTPEKIFNISIDPLVGLLDFQARDLAFLLGFKSKAAIRASIIFIKLYKAFLEEDCEMLEINPLVLTKDQQVIPLDAKISIEDNSLYRHPNTEAYRDLTEEDPSETRAKKFDLSFIKLDGSIGCLVNGAGLAMATMDIIKTQGSLPANFLDVGGSATKEKVTEAFKIILQDSQVKGILVNIFGGIMKCDIIAEGVIAASKEVGLTIPLVVRLEGTNAKKGKDLLANSDLNIITADSLDQAAQKIIAAT